MFDELKKLYELSSTNLVMGNEVKISEDLTIIPVFKAKLNYFKIDTKVKENDGNVGNTSLLHDPVCFIEIKDGRTTILPIKGNKDNVLEQIPDIIESFDFNNIFKRIKI